MGEGKRHLLPPIPKEVWASGDPQMVVMEMLLAIGEEFNTTIWYNGVKLHQAEEGGKKIGTGFRTATD